MITDKYWESSQGYGKLYIKQYQIDSTQLKPSTNHHECAET
jgi:hypothetical protein